MTCVGRENVWSTLFESKFDVTLTPWFYDFERFHVRRLHTRSWEVPAKEAADKLQSPGPHQSSVQPRRTSDVSPTCSKNFEVILAKILL